MRSTPSRLRLWAPRLLGLAVCLFLGLFALDAFDGTGDLSGKLAAFGLHLVPVLVLLAVVVLSWRRQWIGGVTFVGVALFYATVMAPGRPDWIAVIAGPLFLVGILFLWSWRHA
jgi:hypothetical protein